MNTSKTPRRQKLLMVSLFAAFAAQALVSQAADSVSDTQARVRSVLQGTQVVTSDVKVSSTPARSWNVEADARRILLGSSSTERSGRGTSGAASTAVSIGSNGLSSSEVQTLTQRVVLGRSAS